MVRPPPIGVEIIVHVFIKISMCTIMRLTVLCRELQHGVCQWIVLHRDIDETRTQSLRLLFICRPLQIQNSHYFLRISYGKIYLIEAKIYLILIKNLLHPKFRVGRSGVACDACVIWYHAKCQKHEFWLIWGVKQDCTK